MPRELPAAVQPFAPCGSTSLAFSTLSNHSSPCNWGADIWCPWPDASLPCSLLPGRSYPSAVTLGMRRFDDPPASPISRERGRCITIPCRRGFPSLGISKAMPVVPISFAGIGWSGRASYACGPCLSGARQTPNARLSIALRPPVENQAHGSSIRAPPSNQRLS